MKYYLHDTNSLSDEKVTLLFIEYGYEAVGLFYVILEKLALQEKPVSEKVLKIQLKIGKKLTKQLKFMYEIGILSIKNGDVFNENILKFSEKYQIKKEKTRKRVSEWRDNKKDKENVTSYKHVRNTDKVKESKVKESKVNNIILPFQTDNFIKFWDIWKQYKIEQHKFTFKSDISEQASLKKLATDSDNNEQIAIEIIENSIANGYKGLFKQNNYGNKKEQQQSIADFAKTITNARNQ